MKRRIFAGFALRLLFGFAGATRVAAAAEPGDSAEFPAGEGKARAANVLERLAAGKDLVDRAPAVAEIEGAWSIVMQLETLLTSRRWDTPQPQGLLAQEATRVLYGTSWSAMIALEGLAASLLADGRFEWLAEAHYRTDWIFGTVAPGCSGSAGPGCGAGIGSYGGLYVRPRGSALSYEITGGWLEQRILSDERRTLEESSLVLSPLAVSSGVREGSGALGIEARLGLGAYFGLHAAHVHPTRAGERTLDVPWHELYPIDVGVGPGGRAELAFSFGQLARLEGALLFAPLALGSRRPHVDGDVLPLGLARRGVPCIRTVVLGASAMGPSSPLRLGLSLFLSELSTRPVTRLGHGGFMLRFDFPLRTR